MKVLVTGSRDWTDTLAVKEEILGVMESHEGPYTLIEGGCSGADRIARKLATEYGWTIITEKADWSQGRMAGPIRNTKMIEKHKPNIALCFRKNNSRGTADCVNKLRKYGIHLQLREEVSP